MSTTKITYRDYDDVTTKDVTIESENWYDGSGYSYAEISRLNNWNYRDVINYASLDGTGIDLTDDTLECAESKSNIGVISTECSGTSVPSINYTFSDTNYYCLTTGITITPHDNVPFVMNTMEIGWDESRQAEVTGFGFYEIQGKTFIKIKNVKSLDIWFDFPEDEMHTIKIDGIDFGEDVAISNIFGAVECFAEIDPSFIDIPSGTCDFTAEFDREPQSGKTVIVESDGFKGKYIIDTVERKSNTIYDVKCYDDLARLDNFTNSYEIYTYEHIKYNSGISIDDDNLDCEGAYKENIEDGTSRTYRQMLAMWGLAFGKCFTSFNTANGVRSIDFSTGSGSWKYRFTPDDILGRAEYKKTDSYANVTMLLTLKSGTSSTDYTGTASAKIPSGSYAINDYQITNHMIVKKTGTTEAYSDDDMNATCANASKYINGSEITATVLYTGFDLGDWVLIQTPYNGSCKGIIKSIQLSLSTKNLATIIIKEKA